MALSFNLGYQESISVHPTRRQNFAGKVYSNFPNIWQWVILSMAILSLSYSQRQCKYVSTIKYALKTLTLWDLQMNWLPSSQLSAQQSFDSKVVHPPSSSFSLCCKSLLSQSAYANVTIALLGLFPTPYWVTARLIDLLVSYIYLFPSNFWPTRTT